MKLFNKDADSLTRLQHAEMEELLCTQHWTDWKHQGCEKAFDAITPHKHTKVKIDKNNSAILDRGNCAGSLFTSSAPSRSLCKDCLHQL